MTVTSGQIRRQRQTIEVNYGEHRQKDKERRRKTEENVEKRKRTQAAQRAQRNIRKGWRNKQGLRRGQANWDWCTGILYLVCAKVI